MIITRKIALAFLLPISLLLLAGCGERGPTQAEIEAALEAEAERDRAMQRTLHKLESEREVARIEAEERKAANLANIENDRQLKEYALEKKAEVERAANLAAIDAQIALQKMHIASIEAIKTGIAKAEAAKAEFTAQIQIAQSRDDLWGDIARLGIIPFTVLIGGMFSLWKLYRIIARWLKSKEILGDQSVVKSEHGVVLAKIGMVEKLWPYMTPQERATAMRGLSSPPHPSLPQENPRLVGSS